MGKLLLGRATEYHHNIFRVMTRMQGWVKIRIYIIYFPILIGIKRHFVIIIHQNEIGSVFLMKKE